jgi:hypothetical protein
MSLASYQTALSREKLFPQNYKKKKKEITFLSSWKLQIHLEFKCLQCGKCRHTSRGLEKKELKRFEKLLSTLLSSLMRRLILVNIQRFDKKI